MIGSTEREMIGSKEQEILDLFLLFVSDHVLHI